MKKAQKTSWNYLRLRLKQTTKAKTKIQEQPSSRCFMYQVDYGSELNTETIIYL